MRILHPIFLIALLLIPTAAWSAAGNESFQSLRFAPSARSAALGGNNISLVASDPMMTFHNPALLGPEMDNILGISYVHYLTDINMGSAIYTRGIGKRSAWGVSVQYLDYGKFTEATPDGTVIGTFGAQDMSLNGHWAMDLSDHFRGGVSGKFLYSTFESYTSIALAVDLGLSYLHKEKGFSAALTFKNLGGQITTYGDGIRGKLPWDLQLGITQRLAHAPIRFSLTMYDLLQWRSSYYDAEGGGSIIEPSGFKNLVNHFIFGIDFVPSENFWLGIGFNPRVNAEMTYANGNKFAGFTAGGGIRVRRFDIGVSYLHYHPSMASLQLSVAIQLGNELF